MPRPELSIILNLVSNLKQKNVIKERDYTKQDLKLAGLRNSQVNIRYIIKVHYIKMIKKSLG